MLFHIFIKNNDGTCKNQHLNKKEYIEAKRTDRLKLDHPIDVYISIYQRLKQQPTICMFVYAFLISWSIFVFLIKSCWLESRKMFERDSQLQIANNSSVY